MTAAPADAGPGVSPAGRSASGRRSTLLPFWWMVVAWVAMATATVWSTRANLGLDRPMASVVAGLLFAVSAVGTYASAEHQPQRVRPWAVGIAIAAALACVIVSPRGLAEVPLFLSASRIPYAFGPGTIRWVTIAATAATSATVGYASHSMAGLLAGVGVPFLAQRTVDRRALIEQRDRAEALVVEVRAGRDAEAQAAALRERAHIAREMHDVLAHSLAGLSLQLQAARALAQKSEGDPRLVAAIDHAADLARDGLAEARSAVGTLAAPALRGVDDLADLARAHPGDVRVSVSGDAVGLPATAQHAVYRAVQEAITNAGRYAPGSPIDVVVGWQPDGLRVEIVDEGVQAGHAPAVGHGNGLGLDGMRSRVGAVGGSVEAGPYAEGWRVVVAVPLTQESTVGQESG